MVVCHAGGCWFWLTAVRAALLSVSGHFAKQAYYLQRQSLVEGPGIAPGGWFGSGAMRQALNRGDRYRHPPLLGSCRPLKTPWRDVPRSTNITKESIFSVMWQALRPQGPLAWASVRYWFGFFAFYLYCLIMWLLWVRYHFREKHRLPTRAISTSPHGGNGAFFVGLYRLWLPAWKRLTQSQNEFNRNHNLKQKSLIYHQLLILNIDLFPSHPAASQVLVKPSACLLCMTSKPL